MIQYVEKLFQESKTIILPGLGALTITNPDTKEMMFMPYLKHDDGVLSGFIEKEAGISSDEAKKMVSDEVHKILNDIETGKSVPFGAFGTFQKDSDGNIAFENKEDDVTPEPMPVTEEPKEETPIKDTQKEAAEAAAQKAKEEEDKKKAAALALEAKKKAEEEAAAKKAEEAAKIKAEEEAKAKKDAELAAKKKAEEEAAKAKEEKLKEEKKVTPVVAAPITPKEEPKEAPKSPEKSKEVASKTTVNQVIPDLDSKKEKNILEKEEIAANQQKLDKLKKDKEQPQKKKRKRGAGFYILISLLFIIVAGGTFIALNYDQAKEYLPFLADSEAAEPTKEGDGILDEAKDLTSEPESTETEESEMEADENTEENVDESASEETVEETPVEVTPEPTPIPTVSGSNNQPFHIVAGVFSEASNAERLATKIKGMGYPAKTFSRGAQTVVSVQSYATAAEAQAALPTVQDAAPKGWVLEWR